MQSYCWKAVAHFVPSFSSLSSHIHVIMRLILTRRAGAEAVCSLPDQSFKEVAVSSLFFLSYKLDADDFETLGDGRVWVLSLHMTKPTTSQERLHGTDTYKQEISFYCI